MGTRAQLSGSWLRRPGNRGWCSGLVSLDGLLHRRAGDEPPWKLLPLVLGLAFVARAGVALAGDFVLHPDEIMQYLEPAHRLAFGHGVVYWEYFYGARSWLVPGLVAGILMLFDAVGLGEPRWYVDGVKLVLCALSLAIPAGMYCFARRHFSEAAARMALVAGAFWYELAGFAHKPLTEFVATAPLMGLLALCVRHNANRPRVVLQAATLAVLAAAIRFQYAPIALVLLGIVFLRTRLKLLLTLATAAGCGAVGIFDALTWDSGFFHSYITNVRFNLIMGQWRANESPPYQFLWWLTLAGGGLSALCLVPSLRWPRRYALLLTLITVMLVAHSVQAHKEYRFIFAVIPLWLLIGADLVARAAARVANLERRDRSRWITGAAGTLFVAVSVAGVLNALPYQERVYRAWSQETGRVGFVRNQDAIFAAYRYLARTPGVTAVWQVDRPYYNLPGYYYLHRAIPFYDTFTGRGVSHNLPTVSASVSHLLSAQPDLAVRGYSLVRDFRGVLILRRDATRPPVRQWQHYAPVVVHDSEMWIMDQVDENAPVPPVNAGIHFANEVPPAERTDGASS